MSKVNVVASFAAAFVGSVALAASAQAATITYSGYTVTGQSAHISTPVNVNALAGQIKLDVTGGPDVLAWCVDLYDFLKPASTYTIGALVDDGKKPVANLLSSATIGKIGTLVRHGNALVAGAATATDAKNIGAAIQLAIWSVEYSNLTFTTSSAVNGLLTTYLGNVTSGAWAPDYNIRALHDVGNQTLVVGVPEPSTWAMMFIGFVGLAAMSARRRRPQMSA